MTEWNKYKSEIKQNLMTLSFDKKVEFALIICVELIPDYLEFEKNRKWGDSTILKRGIEILNEFIKTRKFDLGIVVDVIAELDEVIPHMDDFGEIDGSLALNAGAALHESLSFLVYEQDNRLLDVASLAYDSIEIKLWEKYPNLSESEIANHKILISEITKVIKRTKNVA